MMPLINFDNIPSHMISGLGTEELEWVSSESNDRRLLELSDDFLNYLNSEEIKDIPEDITAELKQIEDDCIPQSTKEHMVNYSRRFIEFLKQKTLSIDFENIPKSILNNYLRYFYSELKSIKTGELYSPCTLVCIRAGLYRYFISQLARKDINIIQDREFTGSNQMLKSMVMKYKKSNKPKPEDKYPSVEFEDMTTIRAYFDRSTPTILQNEIIFNLLYFFHLRGRESLPHINKDNISIDCDSTNKRYLRINCDLLTKNAKASLSKKEFEHINIKRVYENSEDVSECPVTAHELYLQKIAHCHTMSLFPKPCKNFNIIWFANRAVLGKNTFDTFLSCLSRDLNLSKRYTNHCLRVTGITILKEAGKSNEEIAAETGHKSALSVQRYVRKRKDQNHQEMSSIMSAGFSKHPGKIIPVAQGKIIIQENKKAGNDICISSPQTSTSISERANVSTGYYFLRCI